MNEPMKKHSSFGIGVKPKFFLPQKKEFKILFKIFCKKIK